MHLLHILLGFQWCIFLYDGKCKKLAFKIWRHHFTIHTSVPCGGKKNEIDLKSGTFTTCMCLQYIFQFLDFFVWKYLRLIFLKQVFFLQFRDLKTQNFENPRKPSCKELNFLHFSIIHLQIASWYGGILSSLIRKPLKLFNPKICENLWSEVSIYITLCSWYRYRKIAKRNPKCIFDLCLLQWIYSSKCSK